MELCPKCAREIVRSAKKGISKILVANHKLRSDRKDFVIPFHCPECGAIDFPVKAVRDVVFLYQVPIPEKTKSGIYLPDDSDYIGGGPGRLAGKPMGIILSIGKGTYNKTGRYLDCSDLEVGDTVYYNWDVPWSMDFEAQDEKKYSVRLCGYLDCWCKVV